MAARSHTKRRLRAASALLTGVALTAATLAGCQSNSDRDLIARDRRMQEDQIYALQDYINQYQQLLCRYRTENASLRRQLSTNSSSESPASAPPLTPPRVNRPSSVTPATPASPQFQSPTSPGATEPGSPSPPPAPTDPQSPVVPPLNSSGFAVPPHEVNSTGENSDETTGQVATASYEVPAHSEAGAQQHGQQNTAGPQNLSPQHAENTILLSGEVVANASGGPRILVDVVPPMADDNQQPFEGSASLMLLTPDTHGQQRNVGRWDFSADDVGNAALEGAPRPTLRFFVELPTGTIVEGPLQLWIRLVPRAGGRLLAQTNIDLSRPGIFSSRGGPEPARIADELIAAANCVEAPSRDADPVAVAAFDDIATPDAAASSNLSAVLNEADWAIAQPGKPANLLPETADKSGAGGWRVSSEPPPPVIAESTPPPAARTSQSTSSLLEMLPSRESPTKKNPPAEKPAVRPSWTPGRDPDSSDRNLAVRPGWSANR